MTVQTAPVPTAEIEPTPELYRVWACDNQVYGPVPVETLFEWAKDGRVFPETWVFAEGRRQWVRAEELDPLENGFISAANGGMPGDAAEEATGTSVSDLRRFKVLAALPTVELLKLLRAAELVVAAAGQVIIRKNEPGDSFYLVLSGEVSASMMTGGERRLLATMKPGDFFGHLTMFTHQTRSADVVANEESRLLRFSAQALQRMMAENPGAAVSLLHELIVNMATYIVDANQRLQREVASGFVWR
jgi:hypothetical protein